MKKEDIAIVARDRDGQEYSEYVLEIHGAGTLRATAEWQKKEILMWQTKAELYDAINTRIKKSHRLTEADREYNLAVFQEIYDLVTDQWEAKS